MFILRRYTLMALVVIGVSLISACRTDSAPESVMLEGVVRQTLTDLTTAPQRAENRVHPDALAVAPALPADWTPITAAVPGVLIEGAFRDDPQARFLIRLPDHWNGKLVVAGAAGTRSEFNGDLIISDFVLQRGYAYAAQNKGLQNVVLNAPLTERTCPLWPVADFGEEPPLNVWVDFFLLDADNTLEEWAERMEEAGQLAQAIVQEHYGRPPAFTYAAGISNGGWQVRKAVEDYPETFDGGLDWEGVYWRPAGPNLMGELPAGLKHYPDYRMAGYDPGSPAAVAIRAAGFPPDVRENGTGLWALNRQMFWEVTQCLFVKEIDPAYHPEPGQFAAFADYAYAARPESVQRTIGRFANSGRVRRPLITVHGTLDALLPLVSHARAYQAQVVAEGFGGNHRLYEVQNGNHLDSFKGSVASRQLPSLELMLPHVHHAFMALERWVEQQTPAPPNQCIPCGGVLVDQPTQTQCAELFVP